MPQNTLVSLSEAIKQRTTFQVKHENDEPLPYSHSAAITSSLCFTQYFGV